MGFNLNIFKTGYCQNPTQTQLKATHNKLQGSSIVLQLLVLKQVALFMPATVGIPMLLGSPHNFPTSEIKILQHFMYKYGQTSLNFVATDLILCMQALL